MYQIVGFIIGDSSNFLHLHSFFHNYNIVGFCIEYWWFFLLHFPHLLHCFRVSNLFMQVSHWYWCFHSYCLHLQGCQWHQPLSSSIQCQCSLFCVLRFLFCALCSVFFVLCSLVFVLFFLFCVLCSVFYVSCPVFSVRSSELTVHHSSRNPLVRQSHTYKGCWFLLKFHWWFFKFSTTFAFIHIYSIFENSSCYMQCLCVLL